MIETDLSPHDLARPWFNNGMKRKNLERDPELQACASKVPAQPIQPGNSSRVARRGGWKIRTFRAITWQVPQLMKLVDLVMESVELESGPYCRALDAYNNIPV